MIIIMYFQIIETYSGVASVPTPLLYCTPLYDGLVSVDIILPNISVTVTGS